MMIKKNKYHQVWKEIFKIVNNENGESKIREKIGLSDSDIPKDKIIKIPSITIVIKSLIEKNNKFHLELALNHSLYSFKEALTINLLHNLMIFLKPGIFKSLYRIFEYFLKEL